MLDIPAYFNTIVVVRSQTFLSALEFFTVCTKLAEMALLYSKELTTAKKVTSSGARPDEIITGLGVQCLTI